MLTEEEALAATAELADDVCGVCRKPYSVHCKDCYCCPGTHDEMCGW